MLAALLTLIDKKAARAIACQVRAAIGKASKDLAEKENILLWHWRDRSSHAASVEGFCIAFASCTKYILGQGVVRAAAFPYALSVGWYGGVLSRSAGYLDLPNLKLNKL